MRHLLTIIAAVLLVGSAAEAQSFNFAKEKAKAAAKAKKAKPAKPAKKQATRVAKKPVHHKKAPIVVEPQDDEDEDEQTTDADEVLATVEDDEETPARTKRKTTRKPRVAFQSDAEEIDASSDEDDEDEDEDEDEVEKFVPVKLREKKPASKSWEVAVGPYLWASSVQADVSLGGGESVSTGVGFGEITKHSKYGAEILLDARYKRFSIAGDLMYGVVGLDANKEVGPLMVGLNGGATSTNLDALGGYRVYGEENGLFQIKARGGLRYQRTTIAGVVNVAGADITPPTQIMASSDALVGARAFVKPRDWFYVSANFDYGLFGDSKSTWSAGTDASVKIKSHFLLSLGYRTLTMDSPMVSLKMSGPRAALQLAF